MAFGPAGSEPKPPKQYSVSEFYRELSDTRDGESYSEKIPSPFGLTEGSLERKTKC
ncbi:MAG TPA: hypothetical protein VJZ93_03695 [Candidatus Nanoarchaeia archaeon]|nr:hypothetical protein [Candidatus Nanoarchaeia archaeon]